MLYCTAFFHDVHDCPVLAVDKVNILVEEKLVACKLVLSCLKVIPPASVHIFTIYQTVKVLIFPILQSLGQPDTFRVL